MLVGYVRVSKSDGSQTLAPQRDVLIAAGVEPDRIYSDFASGRQDDRPGLNACLKALQPGKEPSGTEAPALLGMSVHYLLALRDYNPPALAAQLRKPLLILQGERDYQVSMRDFANWKAALGTRKNVTLKSYPTLNHLFIEGTGKSTPDEYTKSGYVSASVIDDIAQWVLSN